MADDPVVPTKAAGRKVRADTLAVSPEILGQTLAEPWRRLAAMLVNGRTLGKLLLGIRAVKVNGAKFTYFDAFVRQGGYVAGVAMGMIGFLKLLWEPNRQAVEDRIAATVVVKA